MTADLYIRIKVNFGIKTVKQLPLGVLETGNWKSGNARPG